MQQNVKVFIPEMLAEIFPEIEVHTPNNDEFCVTYKINVKQINGDELLKLLTVYLECNIDLNIRRSGKSISIHVTNHSGNLKPRVLKVLPLEVI